MLLLLLLVSAAADAVCCCWYCLIITPDDRLVLQLQGLRVAILIQHNMPVCLRIVASNRTLIPTLHCWPVHPQPAAHPCFACKLCAVAGVSRCSWRQQLAPFELDVAEAQPLFGLAAAVTQLVLAVVRVELKYLSFLPGLCTAARLHHAAFAPDSLYAIQLQCVYWLDAFATCTAGRALAAVCAV
jgi:hypothetical protein